jgi:chemotaxis protein CheD
MSMESAEPAGTEQRVHIVQGEHYVTREADVVLTTLLGSCVAACMRDPVVRVGGMNHFLLPSGDHAHGGQSLRYGVHAMELLVNGILKAGGARDRLEAFLFGGARMTASFADIGAANADFAEEFMRREGIRIKSSSLRGDRARRIQFWPHSGRIRQQTLSPNVLLSTDLRPDRIARPRDNPVELF